ncbi:MAG: carboxypeptidase regulatory-like domain-containing protein [Desulfocapsaceae bacterium]|nr:carboxypeptidase regulatory-like domain-containing protein [Desulfocapsaceae bacterium]
MRGVLQKNEVSGGALVGDNEQCAPFQVCGKHASFLNELDWGWEVALARIASAMYSRYGSIAFLTVVVCLFLEIGSNQAQASSEIWGSYNFDDCTATDSSGNGRHGVIHGTTCLDINGGKYLQFNNANNSGFYDMKDWVTLPNFTGSSLVFQARIKWQNANNDIWGWAAVWSIGDNSTADFLSLFVNDSGRLVADHSNVLTPEADISDGAWHNVEVVTTEVTTTLYIDGVLIGAAPVQKKLNFNNSPHYLSMHQWYNGGGSSSRFYGGIDSASIEIPNQSPGSYNLAATPSAYNKVNLSWSSINGAAIYALYRADTAAGPFAHQVYCGSNTSHVDNETSLAPSTTYYYKVVSGDATANCSSLATGWATPSDAVSATTPAMPQDKISAGGDLNMYNTHTSSDRLKIDIDLVANGVRDIGLCDNGTFRIVDGNGVVVTTAAKNEYTCEDSTVKPNFVKYTLEFKVKKVGARSAFFEDGILQYCPANGTCSNIENGPGGFSFYGTTFDVGQHAWKFANGSWGFVSSKTSVYNYAEKIANSIPLFSGNRPGFWLAIGWDITDSLSLKTMGLCYGLTNSAIANFTHQDDTNQWGAKDTSEFGWSTALVNHWDTDNQQVFTPYKPFAGKTIYLDSDTYIWNAESAKKIMYYFVAQPLFATTLDDNWIGAGNKGGLYIFSTENMSELEKHLKSGNPLSCSFRLEKEGLDVGHQVAITSAIIWNSHVRYMIWDNNFPLERSIKEGFQPYLELYIHNYFDPKLSFSQGNNVIHRRSSSSNQLWIKYKINDIMNATFMHDSDDSQHIYNTDPTVPSMALSPTIAKVAATPKSDIQPKQVEGVAATGHIEVLVVGGAVTGVFNKDTGAKLNLLSEGELTPGQAVQFIRLGGTMYKLYLPVDGQYRIEATKESSTPLLDIYVNIPNADGTLTSIGYDDQTYVENSVEKVMFYVGRGNSDTNVRRVTKGTTYAPSATETVATAVGAPNYFTGLFTSENSVALNWENPVHPNFSKVQIVRKEDSAPASPTDGTMVYEGTAQSFTDTGVTVGKYYFYSIYAVDTAAQYSEPQIIGIDTTKGNISGYVKFADGSGLANTTVTLTKTTGESVNSGITNSQGYFVIRNVPFDSYIVGAEHPVNTIQEAPVSLVIPETTTVDFTAIPGALLVINKGGSGTGKVTSNPAGIDCGADCSEAYSVGASVALTATADAGFSFVGWSGDCSGRLNPLSVTMSANKSCIATFEKKFHWPMFLPGITKNRP